VDGTFLRSHVWQHIADMKARTESKDVQHRRCFLEGEVL
jgi:hypothetical protein